MADVTATSVDLTPEQKLRREIFNTIFAANPGAAMSQIQLDSKTTSEFILSGGLPA